MSWTIAGTNARVDGAPANTDARGEVSAVWVLGTRAAEAQSLTLQAAVERHTATVTVPAVAKPIEVSSVAFSTRDTTVVKLGVATALGVEATDPFGNKFVPAGVTRGAPPRLLSACGSHALPLSAGYVRLYHVVHGVKPLGVVPDEPT